MTQEPVTFFLMMEELEPVPIFLAQNLIDGFVLSKRET